MACLSHISDNIRLVLSDEDPKQAQLYFGNDSHVYSYSDGQITPVRAYTNDTIGVWTVSRNILFYTTRMNELTLSESFTVGQQLLNVADGDLTPVITREPFPIVKGPFPDDIKVVRTGKTGKNYSIWSVQGLSIVTIRK